MTRLIQVFLRESVDGRRVALWTSVILAIVLIAWGARALAQTAVANLAWVCTDLTAEGQGADGTGCTQDEWRWDYGNAPDLLVAGCEANCTAWTAARWVRWASNPTNVWVSRTSRSPGPWTNPSLEGFVPRAQVAVSAVEPPPPPPIGPPAKPWELSIHVANDECWTTAIRAGVQPLFVEAQRYGSTSVVRSDDQGNVTCTQLGLTQAGVAQMVRWRAANAGGASPWTGFWPVLRFNPEPADINQRHYERIHYTIVKHQSENYTLQPTDARAALCLVDGASSGTRPIYARNGNTRGAQLGTIAVGPVTQNAGATAPFDRVECDCNDTLTFSNAVYARVLDRADRPYVAACRHTGSH